MVVLAWLDGMPVSDITNHVGCNKYYVRRFIKQGIRWSELRADIKETDDHWLTNDIKAKILQKSNL